MIWSKTSMYLPTVGTLSLSNGDDLITSDNYYLLLVPNGRGWERLVAQAVWLDNGGQYSFLYWKGSYGQYLDGHTPVYWTTIEMPIDSTEILSDWQDEAYDNKYKEL